MKIRFSTPFLERLLSKAPKERAAAAAAVAPVSVCFVRPALCLVFLIAFFLALCERLQAQEPRPLLRVTPISTGELKICWPSPSVGFVLQSSPSLNPPQWRDVVAPVALSENLNCVLLPMAGADRYYRLRSGCTEFNDMEVGRYPNPLRLGGVVFVVHDFDGSISANTRILSSSGQNGLDVGFSTKVTLDVGCPQVEMLFTEGAAPTTVRAFDEAGNLLDTASTAGAAVFPATLNLFGGGVDIKELLIEAPQDQTLLLKLCCHHEVIATGEFYNPFDVPVQLINDINSIEIDERGKYSDYRLRAIPPKNISRLPFELKPKEDDKEPEQPSKISPVLMKWLASGDPDELVDLLVRFPEDSRIPLLPDLGQDEDREKGGTRREAAIEALQAARSKSQKVILRRLQEFAPREKLVLLDQFWIVNTVALRVRLGAVGLLSESRDVLYLQPVVGGEKPPADSNNDNDAIDGRALIVSDPYFNLGLTAPWIGILDTGVRNTHVMFNSPSHIAWMRDCVNGGPNCNNTSNPGYDPTDFAWNHGTSTAGIITGNDRLGSAFRGVTAVRLDSWQIYRAAGLDSGAAVRGIQAAVAAFDKVLVGEIQANESETGSIATAADNAYDAGAIIVSANGNFGPNASTVRSPGIAHKVLGVGGYMTDGGAQYNNQGRGPATDGRYKPDIQTPTWSETASASSDNALQVFSGTSGATPYASAAAMLSRNWLRQFGTFDNGQVYAFMILYGDNPYPYDNTIGAGRLKMAVNGHAWWGKVYVGNHTTIDIPITVSGTRHDFDASLWWPETAAQQHNDVDLSLIDPSGVTRDSAISAVSIFERARVGGTLATGTWTVRIRGFNVRTGSQVVYWAAHIRN